MFLPLEFPVIHAYRCVRDKLPTYLGEMHFLLSKSSSYELLPFVVLTSLLFCDEGAPWRHDGGNRGVTDRSLRSSCSPELVDLASSNNGALLNHTRLLQRVAGV